ncbi:hypothetical protein AVEN_195196-1 [Araneus ventricosus]|uniref:Uncharacterized protein n=1 Tax=Araneus ventricosus TaxID=182803 RepID=A0A4Y2P0Q3_ARAVE|nr:hypothetical protein AVEN_195196-1 [Araneus ventricosus]
MNSPNEPSCTTNVSFNGVLLPVTGTSALALCKIQRESSYQTNPRLVGENITQDHCCGVHNACSLLYLIAGDSGCGEVEHLTSLRAYEPVLLSVCARSLLETVVPVSESRQRRVDAVLRLFLLAVTLPNTDPSFGVVTRGDMCCNIYSHYHHLLESLPKPGDDTLGDSKFFGYFQLGTSTFQSSDNSTT